jgi:glycosyltransferase involved in cell wall biosynthesis
MESSFSESRSAISIVPWYPFPLHNGGALRAFHITSQLAHFFRTTAILPASPTINKSLIQDALRATGNHVDVLHADTTPRRSVRNRLLDRFTTIIASRSLWQPSNNVSLALLRAIQKTMRECSPSVIVLSELDSLLLVPSIRKYHPKTPIILDMHNVNHVLLLQYATDASNGQTYREQAKRVLKLESSLASKVDYVFACSNNDLQLFQTLNGANFRGSVIPNGVDTNTALFDRNTDKHKIRSLIFCASLTTKANIDGLNWFHQEIWPYVKKEISDVRLIVVGGGCDNPQVSLLHNDKSVVFAGKVEDLKNHYHNTSISICPLRIGSGTRLKIVEAMSYGNPVVSTSLGCEGLGVVDGKNLVIRDSAQDFAHGIISLLAHPDKFHDIRVSARKFAESTFDWNVIGKKMNSAFAELKIESVPKIP